jgi:hypothetical protein
MPSEACGLPQEARAVLTRNLVLRAAARGPIRLARLESAGVLESIRANQSKAETSRNMTGRPKGLPKTGGRKRGTPNKRTLERERAMAAAALKVAEVLGPEAFDGDAHALLMSVYKDTRFPIELRLDAAKAAVPYEKARLASVTPRAPGKSLEQLICETIGPNSPQFGRAMIRDPNSAVADQGERQPECLPSPGYPHSSDVPSRRVRNSSG